MSAFAILVHAVGLRLRNEDGEESLGGLYTWRVVSASTRTEAEELAIDSLLKLDEFWKEILNAKNEPPQVFAEEVQALDKDDQSQRRDTGLVFYIDTSE